MNKFGISYNVFNGEELLLHSIGNHRPFIDHINIVVQYKSNFNELATEQLYETVLEAKKQGLVDVIFEYSPNLSISPQLNELNKRNLGLTIARDAGSVYFMTMDSDEFYEQNSYSSAISYIKKYDLLTTAANSYLHIKRPIYRSSLPDTTCVSFFTKIDIGSHFIVNDFYPCLVDPTRRLHGYRSGFFMFLPDELAMMHMNLVRNDGLRSKLFNTTSANNKKFIAEVKSVYDKWQFGDTLLFPGKPPMTIEMVDDIFYIDQYFLR